VTQTLAGRTVLVTRPAEQAAPLVRALERRGARALVAPTIRLGPARSAPLTAALRDLAAGDFTWIVLTSQTTVQVLRDRLASPRDGLANVGGVGGGTAAALARGRHARVVPPVGETRPASAARGVHHLGARARVPEGLGPRAHGPRRHRP